MRSDQMLIINEHVLTTELIFTIYIIGMRNEKKKQQKYKQARRQRAPDRLYEVVYYYYMVVLLGHLNS